MKTIFRKSTSIILALAMIIGILPTIAIPAAEAAGAGTIVYDFESIGTSTAIDTATFEGGYNWQFRKADSAQRFVNSVPKTNGGAEYGIYASAAPHADTDATKCDLAFDIKVPTAGTYFVSVSCYDASTTPNIGVYIGKNAISETDKVGTYISGKIDKVRRKNAIGTVTFDVPGTYHLLFRAESETNSLMSLKSLTLTPVAEEYASLADDNTVTYDMTSYDGSKVAEFLGITNHGSGSSAGSTIRIAEGFNWEVNDAEDTYALFYLPNYSETAKRNKPREDTVPIKNYGLCPTNSTEDFNLNVYVPKSGKYKVKQLIGLSGTAYADNVTISLNGTKAGTFSYKADTSVVGADLGVTNTTEVELKKGINVITLNSSQSSGTNYTHYIGKITLEATETWEDSISHTYNFRQAARSGYGADNSSGNTALPSRVSLATGSNWEFAPEYSRASLNNEDRAKGGLYFQPWGLYCGMGGSYGYAIHSDVVMRIKVKKTDTYAISVQGGNYSDSGVAAFYLDGVYIGQYDYRSDTDVVYGRETDMRTIDITAGEHLLTMRSIVSGHQKPGVIKLTPVDAAPAVTAITGAAVSDTELLVGESATVSGTVSYGSLAIPYAADITDGAENVGNNAIATVVSSDTEVVKVDGGKITAVGAGTAKITLENGDAVSNEVTVTVTAPVEITEKETFGDVSAYITKTEEGAYNFTAFSGIDSTEYSEVGFIINGAYVPVTDNAVYKKVTVSYDNNTQSMDITPSSFFKSGASEAAYVFYSTKDLGVGFTGKVTFQPYAVEIGKTQAEAIVGYPYSVTLS